MENFTDLLDTIEAAAKGNARLDALKEAVAQDARILSFFVRTSDPFVTFGVQKLPDPMKGQRGFDNDIQWLNALTALGNALAERLTTGHAARDAVAYFLGCCVTPAQLEWGRRYLLRDLRLDIGAKAIRKVFGKQACPLFEIPLAEPHDKVKEKIFSEGRWVWQPKLDGARCVAFVDAAGDVSLKSRTGKPWKNFESVRKALKEVVDDRGLRNVVFDGEVVSLDTDGYIDFQALQKTMQRKDGVEVGDLRYVCFDYASLDEWTNPQRTYAERLDAMSADLLEAGNNVKIVGTIMMSAYGGDQKVLQIPYRLYAWGDDFGAQCKLYVDAGFEGAMLRRTDAAVVMKRSRVLIKVKTFMEGEGICTGLTEGEGKRAGVMGALVLRWSNGNEVKCGSGLSDAKLKELTDNPPIGASVTVKYFELTDAQVPRFPIFKCIRVAEDVPEDDEE